MPTVSRQQQKAMFAAASGHSTLGIPQGVGKDFANADIARAARQRSSTLPQRKPAFMRRSG
ncbi:MAG TPA: hypothetical protein VIJ38_04475 [Acidobacteriaceae bacterium]